MKKFIRFSVRCIVTDIVISLKLRIEAESELLIQKSDISAQPIFLDLGILLMYLIPVMSVRILHENVRAIFK